MYTYECPDCRTTHDEPAEATLGLFVCCLDCALENRYREELLVVAVVRKAA